MDKFKSALKKAGTEIAKSWILKCFLCSLALEIVLEILGRRSILGGLTFVINSPIVYIYNVSIIFFTFLFALFLRKRIFAMIIVGSAWLVCGIINFVVLGFRVTPFAAIDFLMVKDTFSMINVYFAKWQQLLILIGIIAVIVGLVFLFKKTPKYEGQLKVKWTMLACIVMWFVVLAFTHFGVSHNIISDDFANLGMAYKDYGFAYCFTNSIVDNGISKPDGYSKEAVCEIRDEIKDIKTTNGRMKKPNVIVIQLESFFDPNYLGGLTMSENPIPTFTKFKEDYPSGYFTVPAFGAGTANTEFEVLTGIKTSYFGAGEYPYKTTVNEVPIVSMCSLFADQGYKTYAIHNNKSSFYDRRNVYDQMGFDHFISLEYMYNPEYTSTGWAKDKTLPNDIMKCLFDSKEQDFVFTISLQGHGRYPNDIEACEHHVEIEYQDEKMVEEMNYYINQLYEMDQMLADLKERLDNLGEDYVLVLYGDHLPSIGITEEQITKSTLFQTEYVIINNIGLKMEDEDITSNELSNKLLGALNIPGGYAQQAHIAYKDDEIDEKLSMLAYDELYGDNYIYEGNTPVPEPHMVMGVSKIAISNVKNEKDHIVIKGFNFNDYSVVILNEKKCDTTYVDKNTLMVEDVELEIGDKLSVSQIDKSHHELGSTEPFIYK